MGSRDKDQATLHHQPLLSSLVVRPSASEGADGGGGGAGGRGGGNGCEHGKIRHEPLPYPRSDRYSEPGYRTHAGSSSPLRLRDADQHYGSNFDRLSGPPRSRDFVNGRDPGRYGDSSPLYSQGPVVGRQHSSRTFDRTGYGPGPFRGEGLTRNNPNVRPREGDWICPDPLCGNLNFARREYCNNCRRFRHAPVGSPHGGDPGPPPSLASPRRFPGSPIDLSPPGRSMIGFRSPPRAWAKEGPRDFGVGGPPPPRHEGRFSNHSMRRDGLDYIEDDYRGRNRFDRPRPRPMPVDWGHRGHGRDNFFNERKGNDRRPLSPHPPPPLPPQLPPLGRWQPDVRERSRSPIRGAAPPKEHRRAMYLEGGRDERSGVGRNRMGDAY